MRTGALFFAVNRTIMGQNLVKISKKVSTELMFSHRNTNFTDIL